MRNSSDELAIAAVNKIAEVIEHELPEWTVIVSIDKGPGTAKIIAEVSVSESRGKKFYCQQLFDFRTLSQMHPAMLPSRGMDLALRWRNEFRKAKKKSNNFEV